MLPKVNKVNKYYITCIVKSKDFFFSSNWTNRISAPLSLLFCLFVFTNSFFASPFNHRTNILLFFNTYVQNLLQQSLIFKLSLCFFFVFAHLITSPPFLNWLQTVQRTLTENNLLKNVEKCNQGPWANKSTKFASDGNESNFSKLAKLWGEVM